MTTRFLINIIQQHGINFVSSSYDDTWCQACGFLKLIHYFHSFYENNIIERTVPYVKDRVKPLIIFLVKEQMYIRSLA
ncbi:MAG TPA: hypothetical protein VIY08_08670 [Candidatus Nitrosocosmicus sp.]